MYIRYALPTVWGFIAFGIAQVIDAIFVGNFIGTEALAAINLAVPVLYIIWGLSYMLAMGGSVAAGKYIGSKQPHYANDIFVKSIIGNLVLGVGVIIIVSACAPYLINGLGTPPALYHYVEDYLLVSVYLFPTMAVGVVLYYFTIIDNRPLLASLVLTLAALLNIVLDWLFIVIYGWELVGAALATGIAMSSTLLLYLPRFIYRPALLRLRIVNYHCSILWRAAYNGLSEFIGEISVGLITLMFNWVIITRIGVEGVAAFTVVEYLFIFVAMFYYGLSESMQLLVSKNYGAGYFDRVRGLFLLSIYCVLAIGIVVTLFIVFFPNAIIGLFLPNATAMSSIIAADYLKWFWPAFFLLGINFCFIGLLTGLHYATHSAGLSLLRSLLFPAIGLAVLPTFIGDVGIFVTIPLAESITLLCAMLWVSRLKRLW